MLINNEANNIQKKLELLNSNKFKFKYKIFESYSILSIIQLLKHKHALVVSLSNLFLFLLTTLPAKEDSCSQGTEKACTDK
jgi:hypothetical protein